MGEDPRTLRKVTEFDGRCLPWQAAAEDERGIIYVEHLMPAKWRFGHQAEGQTSRVYEGCGIVTELYCPPFYDEQGRRHEHDSNITTTSWCGWPEVKP